MIDLDGGSGRYKHEKIDHLSENLASGMRLEATTPSGSITMQGTDTATCTVKATIRARAGTEEKAEALAEEIEVHLEHTPEGLRLSAVYPVRKFGQSFSISYEITVPVRTELQCKTSSGSITLENIQGNMHAQTSSGSIKTSDLGQGDINCHTSSGSVSLVRGQGLGTCELRTSSGSVKAVQVHAQSLYLKTSSGSVTADQVTCQKINGHTSSGSVRAVFTAETPADLDAELTTSSGGVNVTLPPVFGGQVDLGTHSGSVRIDRPITVKGKLKKSEIRGTLGQGTGRLVARTSSGSVTVK
jgi:DUF4097 and DUF4098 domain-containing protein YvlB